MHIPEQFTCLCDILPHFGSNSFLGKYGLCSHDILKSKEEAGFFSQTDLGSDLSLAAYKLGDIRKVLYFSGTYFPHL